MFHMKKHATYADLLSDVIYCTSRFWSEWSPKHMPLALWSTSRDLSKAQIFIFLQACGPATSTCSTVWSYFENDKSFQRLSTTKKSGKHFFIVLSIKTVRNYINCSGLQCLTSVKHCLCPQTWLKVTFCQIAKNC